jgi:hypothetical protein
MQRRRRPVNDSTQCFSIIILNPDTRQAVTKPLRRGGGAGKSLVASMTLIDHDAENMVLQVVTRQKR